MNGDGISPVVYRVLRLVGDRVAIHRTTILAACKDLVSGAPARGMIDGMVIDGFLERKAAGVYELTPKGHALRPRVLPCFDRSVYKPPKPHRRPGSMDFARHPSVAAGVARPYWAEQKDETRRCERRASDLTD